MHQRRNLEPKVVLVISGLPETNLRRLQVGGTRETL